MENQQKQRPIDKMAQESYSWWGKSFVFIKKEKIKIWYLIFAGAFITGMITALAWSVSSSIHQSSSAAGKGKIPDMGNIPANMCVVNPIESYSSHPVTIYIKCGKNIKKAFYKWEGVEPVEIKKNGAKTIFTAEKNMRLQVYGEFKKNAPTYGYGYGYGSKEFMQNYYYYAQSSESCIDTDGGKDYYTKGETYTIGDTNHFIDACVTDSILMEHWCGEDNREVGDSYTCLNSCQDGACIKDEGYRTSIMAVWSGSDGTLTSGLSKNIGRFYIVNTGSNSATIETINLALMSTLNSIATSSLKIKDVASNSTLATYYYYPGQSYGDTSIDDFTDVIVQPGESKMFNITLDILSDLPSFNDYLSVSIEANDIEWSDGATSGITSVEGLPLTGSTFTN
jgi:hypothetical protein